MSEKYVNAEEKIHDFVKRKSSYIHALQKHQQPISVGSENECSEDVYGVVPPLDKFMKIDKNDAIEKFWNDLEINDIFIGSVTSVQERKFVIHLICFDCGKSRHIESYHLKAQCPLEEIPTENNHDDPLSKIMNGQIIRSRVIKFRPSQDRIIVSLFNTNNRSKLKLGILDEDDGLPVNFKHHLSSHDAYENVLTKCAGFSNPNNIKFLMSKLGITSNEHCSILNQFHSVTYPDSEYAATLRNRQCNKVAQKSVEQGIKKFKNEDYINALNDFNYALDMDTENVDALVARGALYANRSSYLKAISDFNNALKIKPTHKNAKKYLTEVLIARGKKIELDIEDIEQVYEIEKCYKDALQHDPNLLDAINGLKVVENLKIKYTKKTEEEPATIPNLLKNETVDKNLAAKKIRQLLERQISNKNKNKVSSSSSASESDSSSTSSSSSSSSSSSDQSSGKRRRRDSYEFKRKNNGRTSSSKSHRSNSRYRSPPQKRKKFQSPPRRSSSRRSEPRKSIERNRKSFDETKTRHATITSSRRLDESNPKEMNRRHSYNQHDRKKTVDRRHSLSTAAKITKDNVNDILSEINKYEKYLK